jgi:hypothetical protein
MTGSILIIQHRNRGYQKGARAEQGGDGAQKQGFAKSREKRYVQGPGFPLRAMSHADVISGALTEICTRGLWYQVPVHTGTVAYKYITRYGWSSGTYVDPTSIVLVLVRVQVHYCLLY